MKHVQPWYVWINDIFNGQEKHVHNTSIVNCKIIVPRKFTTVPFWKVSNSYVYTLNIYYFFLKLKHINVVS